MFGAVNGDSDIKSRPLILERISIDTADIDATLGDYTGDFIQQPDAIIGFEGDKRLIRLFLLLHPLRIQQPVWLTNFVMFEVGAINSMNRNAAPTSDVAFDGIAWNRSATFGQGVQQVAFKIFAAISALAVFVIRSRRMTKAQVALACVVIVGINLNLFTIKQ